MTITRNFNNEMNTMTINNTTNVVILILGSRLRQGLAKVQAKWEG
jgi:hypothetical protein